MFDLIGDIHGYAHKLEILLKKLGYKKKDNSFSHPSRKVLFLGDYIDRGPQIPKVLSIIKAMVDRGDAVALMGNHEYNAICFNCEKKNGGYLRRHSIKNILQHYDTLKQFTNQQTLYDDYVNWFKTLPLYHESENFRAVHACWDINHIDLLRSKLENDRFNDELIRKSVMAGTPLNEAVEIILKGKELRLPDDLEFYDKDGVRRKRMRIKWWVDPSRVNYKEISVEQIDSLPDVPVDISELNNSDYYPPDEKPVFFGHYWMKKADVLIGKNICCLDYSVAKEGHLVAYRFDGEIELEKKKLIFV
ncbi:serine/threonine protein phosphatase [Chitinispirillum alkaliphilum]|nr:serine/threonine protein phosphatase [Chitinispirillum alkaliphilum]